MNAKTKQHFDHPENGIRYSIHFFGSQDPRIDQQAHRSFYLGIARAQEVDLSEHF